jgi:hypothetical protein
MQLYVLAESGRNIASAPAPMWGASRVTVTGNNWQRGRASAARHAIEAGHRTFAVMVGTVELYRRPHQQQPLVATEFDRHGLWIYMMRLAWRFGHVYVPPLQWSRVAGKTWEHQNNPTIPLVAAYQTKAVAQLADLDAPWGYELCRLGYDSFTLSDYFHWNYAPHGQLDEVGSRDTWHRAYKNSVRKLL